MSKPEINVITVQLGHQIAMGKGPTSFNSLDEKMDYLRDLCLALNIEVAEFLQELPWKPWCDSSGQKNDEYLAGNEAVDIIIFALNIWINLGNYQPGECANELIKRINQKQAVNLERLQSGYNKTLKN